MQQRDVHAGSDKPAATAVELMTRIELLHTVKRMHQDMEDMHKRFVPIPSLQSDIHVLSRAT
jgi:hypothetical protein